MTPSIPIEELLPCPFCEADNASVAPWNDAPWAVECACCGAEGPSANTKRKAVEAWNTRADTLESLAAENERYRKALEAIRNGDWGGSPREVGYTAIYRIARKALSGGSEG